MLNQLLRNAGLKQDAEWAKFVFQCFTLALILHVIAAVRSTGFYHVDEHFQIIEFMNYKLGHSPALDLPLEYGQLMRPWLMSAIFSGITTFYKALGITSPFDWALGYRLFCGAIGFLCTAGLTLNCYHWFPQARKRAFSWRNYAVLALTLIWYLPALHARHSSENLSGSVFFIGISLLALYLAPQPPEESSLLPSPKLRSLAPPSRNLPPALAWTVGILFGLAFEFRYQTGFMILGALLWLAFIARAAARTGLLIVAGAIIAVLLGTLADRWGYGQWTFAPWNYVKYNIVQNHVSDSDVTPWWDYLKRAFTETWPPLGFVLLLSFPLAWWRNSKHLLTWSTLPLFIIHELIGHKELRFLFPLIHVGPVLFILGIQHQRLQIKSKGSQSKVARLLQSAALRGFTWCLIGMNSLALVATTLLPAWGPVRFYEQLYHFTPYGFQLYYKDYSLFDFGGAKMNFYKPTHLPLVHVKEYTEVLQALKEHHHPLWLFTPRRSFPSLPKELKGELHEELNSYCQVEFSTLPPWPQWLERLNPFGLTERITNWTLHRCENKKSPLSQGTQ